jgi:glycosyltransferase involved in cell wall biosynthesis
MTNSTTAMPKVSVFMMAYNHAPYVAQALDSALAQKTEFPVEIVIGEDNSTDGTRSIVKDYVQRYPTRIRALLHETNIGAHRNQIAVFEACKGEYLALLEGDDYWTDPLKLQKQVSFLDKNPDYALCFHNVLVLQNEATEGILYNQSTQSTTTTSLDLAIRNYIATVSCMLRRSFPTMPEWFERAPAGDYSLHMMHARYGKIGYLPEVMAVYREHEQSSWQSKSSFYKKTNWFKTLAFLIPEFDGAVQEQLISSQLAALQSSLADDMASATEKSEFLAANAAEIQSLLNISQPQFERQRLKINSLEHRLVSIFVEPLRSILNR